MEINITDAIAFILFIIAVIGISLYASRKEESSEDYFLAGRGLSWWLIGFSLIASNISTEQFVGMAGSGFTETGLAVASYEWIAAITLVFVGLFLLPKFLKLGIYTMPEFLEHRYGLPARTLMAAFMLVAYVGVAMAAVLYSGAIGLSSIFGIDLTIGIWLIGILAGLYTIYGGLKAVVWSDLLQGAALMIGGTIVAIIAFDNYGGVGKFLAENKDKLHMVLPADHSDIPWTALLLGIWIPNFFYWGFNQFITQRTLGAKNLAEGQKGIIFAAFLKLLIPFIIVFPGILAFNMYADQITNPDQAYPILIKNVLPAGLRGILFAALFGAVMSSLDSMLNSASTIFTMDIYNKYFNKKKTNLVKIGRITTGVLVIFACLLAPLPAQFEGVFQYIQMIWGFISPGIVAVFLFGIIFRRAPLSAAMTGLFLSIPVYGLLLAFFPEIAFLNSMAISFCVIIIAMSIITYVKPLPQPYEFKTNTDVDLTPSPMAKILGPVVVIITIGFYIYFW